MSLHALTMHGAVDPCIRYCTVHGLSSTSNYNPSYSLAFSGTIAIVTSCSTSLHGINIYRNLTCDIMTATCVANTKKNIMAAHVVD